MKRLLSIFCAISVAVLSSSCGSMQTEIDQTNQNLETIQSSMNPLQEESYKSGDSRNKSLEGLRLSQEDAYCVQWSGWTLEKYMEESSCIFYGKCIGKNATQHGSSELQFDIQKIYKGVYEPEIKMFHSLLSEPFEIGKEYLIFCGHDASVYSGKDIYGISTVICEMKDGLYHEGILGLEKENMQSILKQVSSYMEKPRYRKVGGYSGGMKQRLLIAQALLNDPDILIMDEPTAGLDPKERIRVRNFISEMSAGKIVLFATHVTCPRGT